MRRPTTQAPLTLPRRRHNFPAMDAQSFQSLTAVVAPIVLVSAAGLLFNGMQTKNLHISDRIRALNAELRGSVITDDRRRQVMAQMPFFDRRIRLSQRALELLYIAILCFVVTSLVLAVALWIAPMILTLIVTTLFAGGVILLIVALMLEFTEMRLGLRTIEIEVDRAPGGRP